MIDTACKRSLLTLVFASVMLTSACSNTKAVQKAKPDRLQAVTSEAKPQLIWSAGVGSGGNRSGVRYTPYLAGETVFAINDKGELKSFDRTSGTVGWEIKLNTRPTGGIGGDDKYLYLGNGDGKVYSIDQTDGSVVWTTSVSSEVISPPTAGRDFVIVRSSDGRVYALDKLNGARRWVYSYSVPALSLHGNGRPLVVPDGVLVGLDNGRLAALRSADGAVVWEARLSEGSGRSEIDRLNDLDADLVIDENSIYAVNYQGAIAKIDPTSGSRRWSIPMSSVAGLDVNDSVVVVTDEFDTVWGIRSADGEVLWKQEGLSNRELTAPLLIASGDAIGDAIVADFEGYLHVLSGQTGEITSRVKAASGRITSAPLMVDGTIYVLSRSGKLVAVKL